MTPQLSPESLEQIRAIVQTAVATALETTVPTAVDAAVATALETRVATTLDRRFEDFERRQDVRFEAIDRQFVEVRRELQEGLAANGVELQEGLAENRRHFGVLAESLQSKIELVIEGQMGLREDMNRRFKDTDAKIDALDRRMVRMSARIPVRRRRR